jgi:hypothetical protein
METIQHLFRSGAGMAHLLPMAMATVAVGAGLVALRTRGRAAVGGLLLAWEVLTLLVAGFVLAIDLSQVCDLYAAGPCICHASLPDRPLGVYVGYMLTALALPTVASIQLIRRKLPSVPDDQFLR